MSTNSNTSSTHLVAGFVGGLTSSIFLQPLDLLKTRVQQTKNATITSELKRISHVTDLWRGTIPSGVRTSVGSALYLTFLNITRTFVAEQKAQTVSMNRSSRLPKLSSSENLMTGMFARSVIGFVTMPVTVIKVRYESVSYNYSSMGMAFRDIFTREGPRGFFNGFWATTARDAPNAGLYVLFYEHFKSWLPKLIDRNDSGNKLVYSSSKSALINSMSATLSASLSTIITAPFDTIKTCMQLYPQKYPTLWGTGISLVRTEGISRMFNGLSLRLIRKAGSAGIAWCIYEELIKLASTF
ncbi:BA75_04517T0 [Komagataella pastoris]|uniref:Mitochondrial glycine transporter n=1 Tax=Komagataella pastoris TaxID=4922 RepID=A0A1B2JIL8_PICPA|nr:BA75_04517T0 [Komagataella pastoris]